METKKENNIKLYNGDCIHQMDLFLENGIKFDISFTSPPYNRKRNDKYSFYDDTIVNYFDFLVSFTDRLLKLTREYVFINLQANYYNRKDVYKFIGHYSDKIQNIIIWEKTNPLPASGLSITNAVEYFIVLGDKSLKSNKTYTKNIITTSINNQTSTIHKAIMNYDVCEWHIKNFTKEGQTIFDPFMGTGTTGLACKKLNRNFTGIEINETYFLLSKTKLKEIK